MRYRVLEFQSDLICSFINTSGVRTPAEFEYEKTIADANRTLDRSVETVFLTGEPQYTSVASTIVRDILRHHGDASPFLPEAVIKTLKEY